MKLLFSTTVLIVAFVFNIQAQSKFNQNMQKALDKWSKGKSTEAVSILERVASVEKQQWLPHYYIGLICTVDILKKRAQSQTMQLLKKAKASADNAIKISPDNSELFCLKGLINTAEIVMDPVNNGRRLSPVVIKNYKHALDLDKNNPRANYLLAEYKINMAQRFGEDPHQYLDDLKKAKEKFDNFKAPSQFHPKWGRERVEQLINLVNEK